MKKLALLIVVPLTFSFSFCKKDMTCKCDSKTVSNGPSGSSTTNTSATKTLHKVTKSEGRVNCMSTKYSVSYYTILGDSLTDTEVTCSLN